MSCNSPNGSCVNHLACNMTDGCAYSKKTPLVKAAKLRRKVKIGIGTVNSARKDRLSKLREGIQELVRNGSIPSSNPLLLNFLIQELRNVAHEVEKSILDEDL